MFHIRIHKTDHCHKAKDLCMSWWLSRCCFCDCCFCGKFKRKGEWMRRTDDFSLPFIFSESIRKFNRDLHQFSRLVVKFHPPELSFSISPLRVNFLYPGQEMDGSDISNWWKFTKSYYLMGHIFVPGSWILKNFTRGLRPVKRKSVKGEKSTCLTTSLCTATMAVHSPNRKLAT